MFSTCLMDPMRDRRDHCRAHALLVCVACEYNNILIFVLCVTLLLGGLCIAIRFFAGCNPYSSSPYAGRRRTMASCAAHKYKTLSLRFYFRFRSMRHIILFFVSFRPNTLFKFLTSILFLFLLSPKRE